MPIQTARCWCISRNGHLLSLLLILATALGVRAHGGLTIEQCSPNLPSNAVIVWNASTNSIPRQFAVYNRFVPKMFSPSVISNALVFGDRPVQTNLQVGTNDLSLWDYPSPGDPQPGYFVVSPRRASIDFVRRLRYVGSSNDLPSEAVLTKRAWEFASKLNLPTNELFAVPVWPRTELGPPSGREIWLSRKINGIPCGRDDNHAYASEGLHLQLGSGGVVRSFSVTWFDLVTVTNEVAASPDQIIACIRNRKTPVIPSNASDGNLLERIKQLAHASKITITSLAVYYSEGAIGEDVGEQETPLVMTPIGELDATADIGASTIRFRMACPVTVASVKKLLSR